MTKRIIALILASMCCLTVLTACKDKPDEGNGDNPPPTAEDIVLISDGACKFVIVGDADENYIKSLQTKVNSTAGVTPDVCAKGTTPAEGMKRIVIGTPEDAGVPQFETEVPYFGYVIKAHEGDIYVLAYSGTALSTATSTLQIEIGKAYADGTLKFAGDLLMVKDAVVAMAAAPYFEGAVEQGVSDCDDNYYMMRLGDVEKAEFDNYCAKLVGNGYTQVQANDPNGNMFRTYTNAAGEILHAYWVEYSREAKIITAKKGNVPVTSTSGNNNLCTPTLYTLRAQAGDNGLDGGLGLIIRLADGRFIVIDGGDNVDYNGTEIYNTLKSNAPDKNNIVIAAWIITHPHGDHYGGFENFAKRYNKDSSIKIECFMMNACYTAEQIKFTGDSKTTVEGLFAKYYNNVPIYKPLTGQVYTFSTTKIEILYTMSDFLPNVIKNEPDASPADPEKGDGNQQTMVFMVDMKGNGKKADKLFIMGDGVKTEFDEICKRYKNYIECNFVQVAHHGHGTNDGSYAPRRNNGTAEIYGYINPKIAFFPTHSSKFSARRNYLANKTLLNIVSQNGGTYLIAGDGQRKFEYK